MRKKILSLLLISITIIAAGEAVSDFRDDLLKVLREFKKEYHHGKQSSIDKARDLRKVHPKSLLKKRDEKLEEIRKAIEIVMKERDRKEKEEVKQISDNSQKSSLSRELESVKANGKSKMAKREPAEKVGRGSETSKLGEKNLIAHHPNARASKRQKITQKKGISHLTDNKKVQSEKIGISKKKVQKKGHGTLEMSKIERKKGLKKNVEKKGLDLTKNSGSAKVVHTKKGQTSLLKVKGGDMEKRHRGLAKRRGLSRHENEAHHMKNSGKLGLEKRSHMVEQALKNTKNRIHRRGKSRRRGHRTGSDFEDEGSGGFFDHPSKTKKAKSHRKGHSHGKGHHVVHDFDGGDGSGDSGGYSYEKEGYSHGEEHHEDDGRDYFSGDDSYYYYYY